jgi:hypothetical protein
MSLGTALSYASVVSVAAASLYGESNLNHTCTLGKTLGAKSLLARLTNFDLSGAITLLLGGSEYNA